MEKSGGFDMSKMSIASKIIMGAGILLLIDSFLQWQRVCFDFGGVAGLGNSCGGVNAWSGSGSFFGLLMGLCVIVLLVWEGMQVAGMAGNIKLPISASKASAYLGFGVVGAGILKLILVLTSALKPSLFGWIGLILILAVGYGAWMKFQEPETTAPPMAPGGTDGGFTA
ncbi:MAG: hypothetical protein ACXWEJ_03645 [Actinomycetota bacterium]